MTRAWDAEELDGSAIGAVDAPSAAELAAADPVTGTVDVPDAPDAPDVSAAPDVPAARSGVRERDESRSLLVRRWRATSGTTRYVAALAAVSAAAAVLLRHNLFPYLSINNDEVIYLLHAQTLAEGRLFPPAPEPAASYAPWLAAVVDGHYVLKYTPFVPALLAASLLLTGSVSPALALVAASAVIVTYLLGVELSGDRRVAALAATLLALSPLVIIQSALLLSYLPVLVLIQLVVLGLLRGLRTGHGLPLSAAGLTAGIAVAVRPYDVVLLLAPMAIWAVVTMRGRLRWATGCFGAGLLVPTGIVLAFNAAATGHPLTLPFALLEPDDRLGFGVRRLYPSDGAHHFGLSDGLASVGDHLWLLGGWACGGVVLAASGLVCAVRRRLSGPGYSLGAGLVLFLLGYVGFWGAWNAAELWGGIRYVGPFYMMPVLIVLVHLGAGGLVDLAASLRRLPVRAVLGAVAAGMVGLTAFVLTGAVRANLTTTAHDHNLTRMLDDLPGRPLVLVAASPPYLGHPSAVTANPPGLDGSVLFAVSGGVDDLRVLTAHPDRAPYLLRMASGYNRSPDSPSNARVEDLRVVSGREVGIDIALDAPPRGVEAAYLVIEGAGRKLTYPVDVDGRTTARLTVDADGLDAADITDVAPAAEVDMVPGVPAQSRSVTVLLRTVPPGGGPERTADRQTLPVAVDGEQVTVLAPTGEVARVGEGRRPAVRLTLA